LEEPGRDDKRWQVDGACWGDGGNNKFGQGAASRTGVRIDSSRNVQEISVR